MQDRARGDSIRALGGSLTHALLSTTTEASVVARFQRGELRGFIHEDAFAYFGRKANNAG